MPDGCWYEGYATVQSAGFARHVASGGDGRGYLRRAAEILATDKELRKPCDTAPGPRRAQLAKLASQGESHHGLLEAVTL